MAEQIIETTGTNTTEPNAVNTSEPNAAPEAKHTDEDVSRIVAKSVGKAEAAIFKKLGINKPDDLKGIIDVLEAARKSANENETAEQAVSRLANELNQATATITALNAKVSAHENEAFLKSLDVFEDADIPAHCAYIAQQAQDSGVEFQDAAREYAKGRTKKPDKVPASATFGGSGKTPLTPTEGDALQAEWDKAKKNRDTADMARVTRIANSKGVKLK